MDRNKGNVSRISKSKLGLPHHGSELFALGSKSSGREDAKSKPMCTSKNIPDRKREPGSALGVNQVKKAKLTATPASRTMDGTGNATGTGLEYWDQLSAEGESVDLVLSVFSAVDSMDIDLAVSCICGAIKSLLTPRFKSDNILSLSLMYIAKMEASIFSNEIITSTLVSILKRDSNYSFKCRYNPSVYVLVVNLLARGYHNIQEWPDAFLKVYIDDAINERHWIDYDDCLAFVANICTAFKTKIPSKTLLQPEILPISSVGMIDDEITDVPTTGMWSTTMTEICMDNLVSSKSRYLHNPNLVESLVIDSVKDQLNRRQSSDCSTRNLLRFLSVASGIIDVRLLAISKLELWLQNGKLLKSAQELLVYICYNITGNNIRDYEVLSNLVKMRLKTKPLINIYMTCLKEILNFQPDTLPIVLKYVVQNELSNSRNPNNMGLMVCIFQTKPDKAAEHLADIYQEILLQREDCLRTLRVFIRELVKTLRYDIKLQVFCKKLITYNNSLMCQIENCEYRDRILFSVADLITLCMLLSVSPQIRETANSIRNGRECKVPKTLFEFYENMPQIQCAALRWMYEIVPVVFKPTDIDYSFTLHKILLLESPDHYCKGDQWPPESERSSILKTAAEIPVQQDTILCIILIGITKDIAFKVPDAIELIEQIIRRAIGLKITDYPVIDANKLEIIDFLFSMAEYHHPENIVLPVGYKPPKLAISSLYWKTWYILLMLSAHNPKTFGEFCWDQYPILRNLMEMCITNQFIDSKLLEDDLQVSALEKTQILEFETHLAAATSKVIITEQNSLLLSQLILMDPMGAPRRPPAYVLEHLQSQNTTYKFGHLLCRSRKPDLLLDIIQRQGTSQSMPWLADLVQNSEGDFNHLPVQCLCEFLLSIVNSINTENAKDVELLTYLQNLLIGDKGGQQLSCEVLEYFLRRLSSTCKQSRKYAVKALRLLLHVYHKEDDSVEFNDFDSHWVLQYLPQMTYFAIMRPTVVVQLRAACQVENNPDLIMIYIQFIAANTLNDSVSDMLEHVMDMSQLIVERCTLFSFLTCSFDKVDKRLQTLNCLFVMFNNYLIKLRDFNSTSYSWPEYPDLLMVHFADGTQLPIHLHIIQAFIILLTSASIIPNSQPILDYWFPFRSPPPSAYTTNTSEQIQILPDWLKLKMIRSSVDRLVDAALQDLAPDQIVLFVQNFGTPVNSVSKLLALLDRAVIEQFEEVQSTILNKAYLAQLIEIQQARGAKNGHIVVHAIELHSQKLLSEQTNVVNVTESLNVELDSLTLKHKQSQSQESTQESQKGNEIKEILNAVFTIPVVIPLNIPRFRKLVQQLISTNVANKNVPSHLQTIYGPNNLQANYSTKVLNYLHSLPKSVYEQYGCKSIYLKTHICTLFRSLFTWISEEYRNYEFSTTVIKDYVSHTNTNSNVDFLFKIMSNKRNIYSKSKVIYQSGNSGLIKLLQTTKISELENAGKQLQMNMSKHSDSSFLIDSIVTTLKTIETIDSIGTNKIGLLTDWLAEIDSELVAVTEDCQLDLLFTGKLKQFRYYMLSLLSHQSSWHTLFVTIDKLLETFHQKFDPASVLFFIGALISNPKLWQGRDEGIPKHEKMENILEMNLDQSHVFTDYILKECVYDVENLNLRMKLLLNCINLNTFDMARLIDYVRCHNLNTNVKNTFLQQLYLSYPSIKFMFKDIETFYFSESGKFVGCIADKVSNCTVTTISTLSLTNDFQTMYIDTELQIRKLAATHPTLILRQLPVLAALLEGRAHMDMYVLKNDHHMLLFNQVIGILEILQPQVFEESYKDALHQALNCCFSLLKYHGNKKDTTHLLSRIVDLLQAYTNHNVERALNFIEPYAELLQYLAMQNRNVLSLQHLLHGVILIKHKATNCFTENNSVNIEKPSVNINYISDTQELSSDNNGAVTAILAPYSRQQVVPQHWSQLVQAVLLKNEDDLLPVLQEIESITLKRQGLLESIFERILELILSASYGVRSIAHILLVRHLKYNSGNMDTNINALIAYAHCLRDGDPLIVLSALETLSDMVMCLQEFASNILNTVFELSIESKTSTFEYMRKCIIALKTQHGC